MKPCALCTGRVEDNESDICEPCQIINRAFVELDEILCMAANNGTITPQQAQPLRHEIDKALTKGADA